MSGAVPKFIAFASGEASGAIVVTSFAILCTLAIFSVAIRVIWLAIRQKISPDNAEPREYVFFNTQLGHYATCLLVSNLCNGISGVSTVRWIKEGGLTPGSFCTFQGVLMQIGNWGTAYFTVVLAVHTFCSLVLKKRQSSLLSVVIIAVGWISAGLLAAGPFVDPKDYTVGPAYGPDGLSCGIRLVYLKAQFFYHLFPIFVASILSAILYSLIFLVLRGTLNIKGGLRLTLDPNERWVSGGVTENYHKFVARIARSMIWYPVAYIALLVPYSVTRLLDISGFKVSFAGIIFAYICWFLLCIVNVLLLYNTFRVLGPAFSGSLKESAVSFAPNSALEKGPGMGWPQYPDKGFQQYQRAAAVFRSPQSSFSQSSAHLPISQDAASVQSFYSYPTSDTVGRAITPFSELERAMTPLGHSTKRYSPTTARSLGEHGRQNSSESLGLPVPPRRTRSPIIQYPSVETIKEPEQTLQPNRPAGSPRLNKQVSTATFGQPANTRESYASDYEVEDWNSRKGDGTLSPKNAFISRSPPSSGNSSYGFSTSPASSPIFQPRPLPSLPRHSRSFSATPSAPPLPAGRQRAILSPSGLRNNNYEPSSGHVRSSSGQAQFSYV